MSLRTAILTLLAMLAFAANSLLCRVALKDTTIDPASFSLIRVASAAVMLLVLLQLGKQKRTIGGNWKSALALLAYVVPFTFAYVTLSAATGALLAFGAVQVTMILWGLRGGERFSPVQTAGLLMAMGGIVALLLPGITAPPLFPALLMLVAGIGWGIYSLRGKGLGDPLAENAGNFLRCAPLTLLCVLPFATDIQLPAMGMVYAVLSGAGASAIGYAIWYAALRGLTATFAATVQLSVPVLTALMALPLLHEPLTLRLTVCSAVVLGGIALVITRKRA